MPKLPSDIIRRVANEFPAELNAEIIHSLEPFEPRVARCILHLAAGNISKFRHNCEIAHQDPRDVMYWAEYDENAKQIHDFQRPFSQ